MANKELYIGTSTPKSNEVVWIRPLKSGGVALYAYVYNKWQVLKLVNGKGTLPVDDDEVIDPATPGGNYYTKDEIDEKIADILGIDADQIDELIEIVTDDDTITGLLTEVKNKANVTKGNVFNIEDSTDKNEFKVGGYGLVISPYSSSVSSDRLLIYYNHLSFTRLGLNPIDIRTFPDSDRLYVGNNPTSSALEYYHPIAYLEDIPSVTPQVQSDWNEVDTTSKAYILNKPTIPTKTSDLDNDSGFITQHQDVTNKANKITIPEVVHEITEANQGSEIITNIINGSWSIYGSILASSAPQVDLSFTVLHSGTLRALVEGNGGALCKITTLLNDVVYYQQPSERYTYALNMPVSAGDKITLRTNRNYYVEIKDYFTITEPSSTKDLSDVEEEIPTKTSDLTNDSGFLTLHQDISGKQDVLVSGTNIKTINSTSIVGSGDLSVGTVTGVKKNDGTATSPDANGVVDLGTVITGVKKGTSTLTPSSGVVTIPQDTTPTNNSGNFITSGGVYTAMNNKEPKLTFSATSYTNFLADRNTYYKITASNIAYLTLDLPTSSLSSGDTCGFNFATGSSFYSFTISGGTVKKMKDFAIEASKTYEVIALYDGSRWLVTATEFE